MSWYKPSRIKWTRRIKRRSTALCPKCYRPATVLVFEGSDSAYLRCYNMFCESCCSNETFHRIVEKALEEEGGGK